MTPETGEHLNKAREYLTKARGLLDVMHYSDEAGRAAYLAAFHAGQALISERTGKIAKTHEGVHSQFNLLTKDDPRVDIELRRFLSRSYDLKAIADYEAGPGSIVPVGRVETAIGAAMRFVDCVAVLLSQSTVSVNPKDRLKPDG